MHYFAFLKNIEFTLNLNKETNRDVEGACVNKNP